MLKDGGLTPTERGLVMHALADAYAHTGPDGRQYGYPFGHLKAEIGLGHRQDHIATNPQAYREYVLSLYGSMTGVPPESNPALQRLLAEIPNFDHDQQKSLTTMQRLARQAGYSRSFVPGGRNLDPTMHRVTRSEMQDLINKIKNACGCK
jgi:hypothetical protein